MLGLGQSLTKGVVPAVAGVSYANAFIFTMNTENAGSATKTFVLPLVDDGTIDINVDWGDSSTSNIDEHDHAEITHEYSSTGTYTVKLAGTIRGFRFANGGDKLKILNISQWGDMNITQNSTFRGCTNLTSDATDAPTIGTTDLASTFFACSNFNGVCNGWDVSSVTTMLQMFKNATSFNQDLNSWSTGDVVNMGYLFSGASAFNGNVRSWDVSKVETMTEVFKSTAFNQNIGSWNTGAVTDTYGMFRSNTAFNQDIGSWNMSSALNLGVMFDGTTAFNQDIGDWNLESATNMWGMFRNATSFDQDIGDWDMADMATLTNFLQGVTLSTENYDALLIGWNAQSLQSGNAFHGGSSTYTPAASDAATARANLISAEGHNWTITDGGEAGE